MAFKGANPKENSTFDEFLKKYHDSLAESMELYTKLVVDVISQDPINLPQRLKKSTNSGGNGEKSKKSRH